MDFHKDKEWLERKFLIENWTIKKIAEYCEVKESTINYWIYDIFKFKKRLPNIGLHKDKEWLYQKYIVEKLTQKEIADLCGLKSKCMVAIWLQKYDIPRRILSDYLKGKKRPPFTEEHKKKMSASAKGRIPTKKHRRNLSKSMKNRNLGKLRICKSCGEKAAPVLQT